MSVKANKKADPLKTRTGKTRMMVLNQTQLQAAIKNANRKKDVDRLTRRLNAIGG